MAKQIFSSERHGARRDLADALLALLGFEGALHACQENGWTGVREELLRMQAVETA